MSAIIRPGYGDYRLSEADLDTKISREEMEELARGAERLDETSEGSLSLDESISILTELGYDRTNLELAAQDVLARREGETTSDIKSSMAKTLERELQEVYKELKDSGHDMQEGRLFVEEDEKDKFWIEYSGHQISEYYDHFGVVVNTEGRLDSWRSLFDVQIRDRRLLRSKGPEIVFDINKLKKNSFVSWLRGTPRRDYLSTERFLNYAAEKIRQGDPYLKQAIRGLVSYLRGEVATHNAALSGLRTDPNAVIKRK